MQESVFADTGAVEMLSARSIVSKKWVGERLHEQNKYTALVKSIKELIPKTSSYATELGMFTLSCLLSRMDQRGSSYILDLPAFCGNVKGVGSRAVNASYRLIQTVR